MAVDKKEINILLNSELNRQRNNVELIASENFVTQDILAITGSILTNKYAEGYPGKRYYGGCEAIDRLESIAINNARQLFQCSYANVQAHSGSQANAAVYLALANPGDTILAMELNAGGHLTHGAKVNFSGKNYNFIHYGVNQDTQLINYKKVMEIALEHKPKIIVAGASNYSRAIDFAKFRAIADAVDAYLVVDMAHIAGLVAGGVHQSPIPYAHATTSTTHKTLRGPRGAIILSNDPEIAKKIDKAVFPGTQGGPLEHVIAAKALCFAQALQPEYATYAKQVVANSCAMVEEFRKDGFKIVSGGTDNHLFSLNTYDSFGVTGDLVETWLDEANITVNKNLIPFDKNTSRAPSGIRIGTPAMTTRGLKEPEFIQLASIIADIIKFKGDKRVISAAKVIIAKMLEKHPLYPGLKYDI